MQARRNGSARSTQQEASAISARLMTAQSGAYASAVRVARERRAMRDGSAMPGCRLRYAPAML